ncbi:prepilin peptidase [Marinomonas ostreistagni]|uniref:Prepilin peptidase n=1 Tax=Marinomonas ostreistagni TaxID=359209 RepID=A0ABS0ZCT4_9GAMM|nr:prepilin peptidase [Marinomonas ostreistagni]MBJ7551476.1 prepilin peptidase [Marinomonas ostreistagni]
MFFWGILYFFVLFFLVKISISDCVSRTVKHFDLSCLTVLLLLSWIYQPNYQILTTSLVLLGIGFVLHCFGVLGAGDTKLIVVLTLGVSPEMMPIMLYGTAFFGGCLVLVFLAYGLVVGMSKVRDKGLPFAVPICMSGSLAIFFSYLSWFDLHS